MRIYYLNAEYETGKHKIAKVWSEFVDRAMPEDSPKTAINVPFSVIEIDERFNRWLARQLLTNSRSIRGTILPDKFYVDNTPALRDEFGTLVVVNLNPNKEGFKTSPFYNMTLAQIDTYIDNRLASAGNVAQLRAACADLFKQAARGMFHLWKETRLED